MSLYEAAQVLACSLLNQPIEFIDNTDTSTVSLHLSREAATQLSIS